MIGINLDLFLELLIRYVGKGANMSKTCIKNQNTNILVIQLVTDNFAILLHGPQLPEVSHHTQRLESRISIPALLAYLRQLLIDLILTARHNTDIEALPRQFLAHGEPYTVRAASNNGPTLLFSTVRTTVHLVQPVGSLEPGPEKVAPEARH